MSEDNKPGDEQSNDTPMVPNSLGAREAVDRYLAGLPPEEREAEQKRLLDTTFNSKDVPSISLTTIMYALASTGNNSALDPEMFKDTSSLHADATKAKEFPLGSEGDEQKGDLNRMFGTSSNNVQRWPLDIVDLHTGNPNALPLPGKKNVTAEDVSAVPDAPTLTELQKKYPDKKL